MYEFLITNLRNCAEANSLSRYKRELMKQAAGAIEKLSKRNAKWEEVVKTALDFIPIWVSVTERLPEKGKCVLCACRANIICVLKWDGIAWVENPTQAYMRSFVTHWMPLPDTPEEE